MTGEFTFKYLIKVIAKERIKYNDEEFKNILFKQAYSSAETFKQGYKELSKKYGSMQIQIQTYQRIGGKWYECPKPRIKT